MSAQLISVDGEVTDLERSDLNAVQEAVAGYAEIVYRDSKRMVLGNEEGTLRGMECNSKASDLCSKYLVGPIVVLTGKDRWE